MFKVETKSGRAMVGDVDVTEWSESDRKAYLDALNATEKANQNIKQLVDDKRRAEESPAALIARAKEEQERAEEFRATLERATLDDLAWAELKKTHGRNRIKRLDTKEGMVVIRTPTEQETVDQGLAMADIAPVERAIVARNYLASLVVHPVEKDPEKPSRVRLIAEKWPGLWDDLDMAVRLLQSARADELRPFV